MKKLLLSLGCAVLLAGCAGPAAVGFTTVAFIGAATNVESSGDEVNDLDEAKDRVVAGVKEGYSQDGYVGYDLND